MYVKKKVKVSLRKYCPYCGEKIDDQVKFCPKCGYERKNKFMSFNIPPNQQSQINSNSRSHYIDKKNKVSKAALLFGFFSLFLFFIYILGLIAIILSIYGLIREEKKDSSVMGLILGSLSYFVLLLFIIFAPIILSP